MSDQRCIVDGIAAYGPGTGVDQKFAGVEAVTLLGPPRSPHAVAIELTGPDVGQVESPDTFGTPLERVTSCLLDVGGAGKQAEIDTGGMLGEDREVDSLAVPDGSQRAGARFQGRRLPESSVSSLSQAA